MILDEPIPNEDAASIIAGKSIVSREVFAGMSPELKARAFVVAGIEDADLLQTIRDDIAEVSRGADWGETRDRIAAALEAEWGDPEKARKRAELLMRQHIFQAEQATRWQTMKRNAAAFPYWQYIAFGDDRVRASHAALDGIVLPEDDPFWEDHFPPWDWGCRCRVRAVSPEDYERIAAEDAKRDPASRRILTDRQRERMREAGTLTRGSGTVDVRSPAQKAESKGENPDKAYGWKPGSLVIPPENIGGAWSEDVRKAFWESADAEPYEGGGSVGDWLRGRVAEVSKPKGGGLQYRERLSVSDEVKRQMGAKGRMDVVQELNRLPSDIFGEEAPPEFGFNKGDAHYDSTNGKVWFDPDEGSWYGSVFAVRHELGHAVHHKRGLVTIAHVDDTFKSVVDADKARLSGSELARKLFLTQTKNDQLKVISDHFGLDSGDAVQEQMIYTIADTLGGMTNGALGFGHDGAYYSRENNGMMEVFSNAFEAALSDADAFKKQFPGLFAYMKELMK